MNNSSKWIWLAVVFLTVPVALGEEQAKKKDKAKAEKSSSGHNPQSNAFTRFFVHTVGAPMARGMKDGMRTVYKGMRSGTHKIKEGFMTIGGYEKDDKKTSKKDGKPESGKLDYPLRRDFKGPALARHPSLRAAFEKYTGRSISASEKKGDSTPSKK